MNKNKKMIEVYRAVGEEEALVIQGLLENYGIPSLLKSNAARSVHAFAVDGMGEVRIMVWERMADKARSLIKGRDND